MMGWGNEHDQFNQGHGWLMAGMGIFWLVVIALVILLIIRISDRNPSNHGHHGPGGHHRREEVRSSDGSRVESAREIIDRRLANGEMSGEQYAEARRLLEG
ncbi:MAG: hypothetical protein WCO08_06720 [Actinomycetes bacterium]